MAGIITSLWNEVKYVQLDLVVRERADYLLWTRHWARHLDCMPKRKLQISPFLTYPPLPHPQSSSTHGYHSATQAENLTHPNFTFSFIPGLSFQFTTAGPIGSICEIYFKAILFLHLYYSCLYSTYHISGPHYCNGLLAGLLIPLLNCIYSTKIQSDLLKI